MTDKRTRLSVWFHPIRMSNSSSKRSRRKRRGWALNRLVVGLEVGRNASNCMLTVISFLNSGKQISGPQSPILVFPLVLLIVCQFPCIYIHFILILLKCSRRGITGSSVISHTIMVNWQTKIKIPQHRYYVVLCKYNIIP